MQSIPALPSSIYGTRLFGHRKILQLSSPISPSMENPERSTAVNCGTKTGLESFKVGFAVIAAVLLSSLVCALTVSVVVRYRMRCRRLRAVLQPEIVVGVEGVTDVACKKINLKALPTMVYTKQSSLTFMDCPICLVEFVEGENVRLLPECSHIFHISCIDAWVVYSPSCPSCRQPLQYVVVEKSSEEVQAATESTQSAQMDGNQRNEGISENHVVVSYYLR